MTCLSVFSGWSPLLAVVAVGAGVISTSSTPQPPSSVVQPNPNVERAGVLEGGVLTVALDARLSSWYPHGTDHPPETIAAFAEAGKSSLMPGPLVRAPAGTELRLSVHNSLSKPLTFFVPAAVHAGGQDLAAQDSLVIAPGAVGTLSTRAVVPGNYLYRGTIPDGASEKAGLTGVLAGAIVIDTVRTGARSNDRVFVIMMTPDSAFVAFAETTHVALVFAPIDAGQLTFTINGRSWPNTGRIRATVGDSLHWRLFNASFDVHPMHLHGFYYRVDAFAGPLLARFGHPAPRQMVVTQLLSPFSTMSMTWSPDRPGNWLFHCHFALHLSPDAFAPAGPDDPLATTMTGLVLGTEVTPRAGTTVAQAPAPVRRLRLVALADGTRFGPGPDSAPAMRFILEEEGRRIEGGPDFSPEVDLVRGEPVAITIVNRLPEATSVHWHGIEIEDSYMDGVPGFSGSAKRLTPAIAPGDSFVARFTPPRSGTFMYHAHVDEVREQMAGLEGALIVRDPGDSGHAGDHAFFLKGDAVSHRHPLEVDGQAAPDTVVSRVGRPLRLRLINLSTTNAAPLVSLTARPDSAARLGQDTMVVRWRPVAKDGFAVPSAGQLPRPARQIIAMGETYDFEYTPTTRGILRLEFRGNAGAHPLLVRVPIRVE